ncbi:MAG: polysaccharide pyruvyl transferase family protein [Candidatus Peribacteraceae bacterium]|nr:polysaccharide pyruvyl transferase family protein [Candidatus Peribacteraceae bacterium]
MRALLVGNYGVGNLGDEALRDYFLARFPDAEWTVVTARPRESREVPRLPCGFRSLFSFRWMRTLRALWNSDVLVFGGGSLFTDAESVRACVLWWVHAAAAWLLRKPFFLAFQGIGPFRTTAGEALTRWVLARAAFVSVRDELSFGRAGGGAGRGVLQSFDPVFLLMEERKTEKSPRGVLTVIPRRNSPVADLQGRIADRLRRQAFASIRILSFQPDDPAEKLVVSRLVSAFPEAAVVPVASLENLAWEVAQSSFVLSARYHGALAALAQDVPFETVQQEEGDKLDTLFRFSSATRGIWRARAEEGEWALRKALHHVAGKKGS